MIKVKLIGATGYGGVGAIEILSKHPQCKIVALYATTSIGIKISEIYPHLKGICDLVVKDIKSDDNDDCDVVLFATPDGVSMEQADKYYKAGIKIIDYSGDFRFKSADLYAEYASRIGKDTNHKSKNLISKSEYGLSEINRDNIKNASVVGNPGCFAVSSILGIYPVVKNKVINPNSIIFDAKTGISGAGKKANDTYHYPNRYEEMNAYKIAKHQHIMEIETVIGDIIDKKINVTFTSQVFPIVRGIMTSIYADVNESVSYEDILNIYLETYKNERFVDVYGRNDSVKNSYVRGSNKCALWINFDERTRKLIVISHIDNLVKGQAGNAIQNLNVMFGLDENIGLDFFGIFP